VNEDEDEMRKGEFKGFWRKRGACVKLWRMEWN